MQHVVSTKDGSNIGDVSESIPRGYGLGIEESLINGHRYYWHVGGSVGFKSITVYSPETHLIFSLMYNRVNQGKESKVFRLTDPFVTKIRTLLEQ